MRCCLMFDGIYFSRQGQVLYFHVQLKSCLNFSLMSSFFLCLNNFYQALRGFHLFILNSNWLSVGYLQLLSFWFQLVLIFFFFCIFCYYPMPVLHIITEDTCYQDTTCSHSNLRLVKSLTSSYYEALQISFKTCGLSLSMAML